jgi:hypothetical protein
MLNRIQIQIFKKLSQEKKLEIDAYVHQYSQEFLCSQREKLEELTEEEGDAWIHKAYVQSMG